jgi:saccharopine dehydrogenase-like NADP-dependent oxidoreductase
MNQNMKKKNKFNIIILGAGGIGRAVGLLIAEHGDFEAKIFIGDINFVIAKEAKAWIDQGNTRLIDVEAFEFKISYEEEEDNLFSNAHIILDCLPGTEAPRIGLIAHKYDLHYVNLTECISETEQLKKIAADARKGFVLQTGLAPGFVNILAHGLYKNLIEITKQKKVDYIAMKVGALPDIASPPHFYGFTWSPIGVATEYLKEAFVIKDFKVALIPSLSHYDIINVGGTLYEECITSGGAADLPFAFEGIANELNYKTLRYPGHYNWVNKILSEITTDENQITALEYKMRSEIPMVLTDVVIIYVIVKGKDASGKLVSLNKSYKITPMKVGNKMIKAIQATTAAAMAECTRMLLLQNLEGLILQSQINVHEFLNGPFIQAVYYRNKETEIDLIIEPDSTHSPL